MNRSDILCLCNFVFKQDVINSKITDFDELQEKFNVGMTCGRCSEEAQEFIEKL